MPKIMMPITALNEDCVKCPELDIQTDQMTYCSEENGAIMVGQNLCCSHWKRCATIYSRIKKDWEENHVTKLSRDIPSDPLGRE